MNDSDCRLTGPDCWNDVDEMNFWHNVIHFNGSLFGSVSPLLKNPTMGWTGGSIYHSTCLGQTSGLCTASGNWDR